MGSVVVSRVGKRWIVHVGGTRQHKHWEEVGWQECEAMRWEMGPMSLLSPRIAGSRWPETAALD